MTALELIQKVKHTSEKSERVLETVFSEVKTDESKKAYWCRDLEYDKCQLSLPK